MNKETLTVKGLEIIKEGKKKTNGEPYTMSKVTDQNGKKHTTFLEGLQIGETYDFLTVKEPFTGKDGRTHEGSKITGFDNVAYEAKKERPAQATAPAVNNPPNSGFTPEDRRKLDAIYDTIVSALNP